MTKHECQCDRCQSACTHRPDWFLPDEAEKAADHLGLSLPDFFERYLGVDWWDGGFTPGSETFLLAPATVEMAPGQEYPADPRGQCVFFENGRCGIHAVKPFECSALIHGDPNVLKHHREVAEAWKPHQAQVEELLGHAPVSEMFCFDEALPDDGSAEFFQSPSLPAKKLQVPPPQPSLVA